MSEGSPALLEREYWWGILVLSVLGGLYAFGETTSTVGGFAGFLVSFFVAFSAVFAVVQLRRYLEV